MIKILQEKKCLNKYGQSVSFKDLCDMLDIDRSGPSFEGNKVDEIFLNVL